MLGYNLAPLYYSTGVTMSQTRIGFVDLGIMGRPMAMNLLKARFPLTVYNRARARVDELAALGAQIAESPSDAAANADITVTIVADSPDVRASGNRGEMMNCEC